MVSDLEESHSYKIMKQVLWWSNDQGSKEREFLSMTRMRMAPRVLGTQQGENKLYSSLASFTKINPKQIKDWKP